MYESFKTMQNQQALITRDALNKLFGPDPDLSPLLSICPYWVRYDVYVHLNVN